MFDDDHPHAYTGGGLARGLVSPYMVITDRVRVRTPLRRGRRPLPRRLPKPSTIVCCLPAMRVRGSASVRRCSLARSHGALRADRPRSAPVAKVPSVRSGVPFTVEDARKPLEPTVTVGRENMKPNYHASLPPQGDPFDRILSLTF